MIIKTSSINGEKTVTFDRVEMALLLMAMRGISAIEAWSLVDALLVRAEA